MKRLLPLLAWAFVPILVSNALAQTGDGYVGIYGDSLGTQACASVPPFTSATLYVIAKTAGQSADGITGAEFRIEVTSPSGWYISYNAPSAANIVSGNPIDTDPDPNAGGGTNLGFPSCQVPDGNGRIKLGTLSVFNAGASPTNLLVKRHSHPTNAGFACPLFVECDDPYYTKVCMTASPPDSCTLGAQKATAVSSADPIVFSAALNTEQSGPPPDVGRHASRVVVWFKPAVVALPAGRTAALIQEASFGPGTVQSTLAAIGAQSIEMLTPTATLENLVVTDAAGTRPLDTSQLDMYRVTLADTNVSAAISALGADPVVLEASPDHVRQAMLVPNDQLFSKEWWLRNTGQYNGVVGADLNAAAAWDRIAGLLSLPVDVVVIDTGVDAGHPELAGRVIDGPNYTGGGLPDDDAPGSHGTSVAGIIGAQGNNTIGVAGVDWNARIVRIKALYADGGGYASDVDAAVDWARVHGYRILNLSLGGYGSSSSEWVVFKNAYMANMAVFAAMGNDNGRTTVYPAAYSPFTIAVGAIMHTKVRWDDLAMPPPFVPDPNVQCYPCGSNTGPHIRFVAPGGRYIETTRSRATGSYWALDPNLGEYAFGGTSAATPAAAGTAALVQSLAPMLTGEDLAQVLGSPARTIDLTPDGWDPETGWGLIDADADVAFVSGQNKIEQGTITSVDDVGTVDGPNRTIFGWPGIENGTYSTLRHTIRGSATFSQPFIAAPTVWPRQASSYGADDTENPIVYSTWAPDVRVHSVNSTQVTFEAFVYDLREQGHGSHVAWWPTTPSGVYFAYTAIGPISVTDAEGTAAARPLGLAVAPIPARSSAHLEFSLAKPGETKLTIYDVAGRLVRSIVAQRLEAGAHGYGWDLRSQEGQPVGSGVYFARLNTPAGTRVTRLVVLR